MLVQNRGWSEFIKYDRLEMRKGKGLSHLLDG